MERVTVTVEPDLLEEFDAFLVRKGYATRSEGMRDALRQMLAEDRSDADADALCIGCVVYMYNHAERALSSRLVETQHHHHEVPVATMHLHVDADTCLEATVLRGTVREVEALADRIVSQTGVANGRLHLIPQRVKPVE